MPSIFLGHGNPMNALSVNEWTRAWKGLGSSVEKPSAVLSISARWHISATAVTVDRQPRTIHDFGGFPEERFEVQYPAPGHPALAERVVALLQPERVELSREWGLGHGTWSVLVHMHPQADVPVVQLSIYKAKPARWHYDLAKKRRPLRDEGVLILGRRSNARLRGGNGHPDGSIGPRCNLPFPTLGWPNWDVTRLISRLMHTPKAGKDRTSAVRPPGFPED